MIPALLLPPIAVGDISHLIYLFLSFNVKYSYQTYYQRKSSESMWTERDLQTMLDPQLFLSGTTD